jgi:putative transposase
MLRATHGGGRARPRVATVSEAVVHQTVRELYLTRQKPTTARVVREVLGRCGAGKLRSPSPSTIRRRLKALSIADLRHRGEEHPEAKPVHGHAPHGRHPLDLVQVDHTPMDLIVVDPIDRAPIGRPWLTIAIDTYSRCIAGLHVKLEARRQRLLDCA